MASVFAILGNIKPPFEVVFVCCGGVPKFMPQKDFVFFPTIVGGLNLEATSGKLGPNDPNHKYTHPPPPPTPFDIRIKQKLKQIKSLPSSFACFFAWSPFIVVGNQPWPTSDE